MKAPRQSQQIAHGTPEALREFAEELFARAQIQAELGVRYTQLGDDTGLNYVARQLAAYTRAILATVADLNALAREASHARHS